MKILATLMTLMATLSSTQASADLRPCNELMPLIVATIDDVANSVPTDQTLASARNTIYDKMAKCSQATIRDAIRSRDRATSEIMKQKGEAFVQVAEGLEKVFEGVKQICPYKTSQGGPVIEFGCYKKMWATILEMNAQ